MAKLLGMALDLTWVSMLNQVVNGGVIPSPKTFSWTFTTMTLAVPTTATSDRMWRKCITVIRKVLQKAQNVPKRIIMTTMNPRRSTCRALSLR